MHFVKIEIFNNKAVNLGNPNPGTENENNVHQNISRVQGVLDYSFSLSRICPINIAIKPAINPAAIVRKLKANRWA